MQRSNEDQTRDIRDIFKERGKLKRSCTEPVKRALMPVRYTEHQDLVGEKDEQGKALSANVVKSAALAVPQKNPTPAKSTASPPTEDLSELQRRPIPADWNPIPFIPSLKDNAFNVVRDYVHIFPSWEDYCEDKNHFHIFLSNLRARVNLDSHDEQNLLVLFKEALQQYRCYLRKSHFDGKSINEFLVKSLLLNLEDIEWKNLVMHWSRSQDESRFFLIHNAAVILLYIYPVFVVNRPNRKITVHNRVVMQSRCRLGLKRAEQLTGRQQPK
nr:hypothetical protein [Triticum aestivum]